GLRDAAAMPARQAEVVGFSFLGSVNNTTLNFTDSTVKNGTTYEWAILTVNSDGVVTTLNNAVAQGVVSATPISNGPPSVPANLVAVAGDGQVTLTWTLNTADDIAGYQVFRAPSANANFDEIVDSSFRNLVTDNGSPSTLALSAGPNDNVVTDRGGTTGLGNGTAVFYRIRAVKMATLQPGQPIDLLHDPRLVSPLSDVVTATPSTAPPRELEVVQPAANSLVDTDLPLLSWRGVSGTPQYTVQLDTVNTFNSANLVQASTTETQLIYPAAAPPLQSGLTYFIRVGVLDNVTQTLRFGPTSSFRRGDVTRYTVTVTSHRQGEAVEFLGASISIDGAVTGKLTRAQFVLNTGQTYHISATYYAVDGTLYSGSTDVTPPLASNTVDLELVPDPRGLAPAAPTGLTAIGQTDRIVLRWNPDPNLPEVGVPGTVVADNYSIRRRENTAEGAFAEIAVLDAPTTAGPGSPQQLIFTDFNVTAGQRYFYQIVARSATGVPSIASVIADAVPGVGVIQVVSPQDNQSFEVAVSDARKSWTLSLHFAWTQVPQAARYIFEIGRDPNLHNLLENGNAVLAASADTVTYSISDSLPPDGNGVLGPYFDRDLSHGTLQTLYWRVIAVDDQNRIINQTEARRLFFTQPAVIAAIPVGP
ncbi:MAG: hypothetical protein HYU66_05930, partial [Armatimonadetes bacterium]|nr:hypothetical protein [Armatimonadota bacterium]